MSSPKLALRNTRWSSMRWAAMIVVACAALLATFLPATSAEAATAVSVRNKAIAAAKVSSAQFSCLNKLWMKESGWNHKARNPYSGAYGIPQAYPASKMASAGRDWRTNPATQIRWGLSYIKSRYKTPCGAWNFWLRNHWY